MMDALILQTFFLVFIIFLQRLNCCIFGAAIFDRGEESILIGKHKREGPGPQVIGSDGNIIHTQYTRGQKRAFPV